MWWEEWKDIYASLCIIRWPKKYIDRLSALNRFNSPLQLLHAGIANIRFLAIFAVDLKYWLLIVNLFFSKIYTYLMKERNLLRKNLDRLYEEIDS